MGFRYVPGKILTTTPGAAAVLHHPAHQNHDSDHHQEAEDHGSGKIK
jgi:hypothetical protein